jgi:hypothetical protein
MNMKEDVWSIYSGDITWERGGKAVHRPFAVWRGKRWGLVNPRTRREQLPTAPQPENNIGACPTNQIEEIILSSDEDIVVLSSDDEADD